MMENEKLLFQKNTKSIKKMKISVNNNREAIFRFRKQKIGGKEIAELIMCINCLENKYKSIKIPVIFDLGDVCFADKLTMIIFENICHYVLTNLRVISLRFNIREWDIWNEGIWSSPLLLLRERDKLHRDKFLKKYKWEIYRNHYRRIVLIDERNNPWLLSKIASDIHTFLSVFCVSDVCREKIQLVISELIGNVDEHTETECLLDIDVTEPYTKKGEQGDFCGINIVVLNYSDRLFGDGLKDKLSNKERIDLNKNPRYETVIDALDNHKNYFDEEYTEEDFYNIASFQHKISGREKNSSTGGTGLTKLIQSLEEMSDAHRCYMLSGNRVIRFHRDFLEYNSELWIGFNKENDFKDVAPDKHSIDHCPVFFPGTAYNLNFAMRKEIENERNKD